MQIEIEMAEIQMECQNAADLENSFNVADLGYDEHFENYDAVAENAMIMDQEMENDLNNMEINDLQDLADDLEELELAGGNMFERMNEDGNDDNDSLGGSDNDDNEDAILDKMNFAYDFDHDQYNLDDDEEDGEGGNDDNSEEDDNWDRDDDDDAEAEMDYDDFGDDGDAGDDEFEDDFGGDDGGGDDYGF